MKRRTLAAIGFYPDLAAIAFDNFLADCKADSSARTIVVVQPLERLEYLFGILGLNADAVVRYGEEPRPVW